MDDIIGSTANSSSPNVVHANDVVDLENATDGSMSAEATTEEQTHFQKKKRKKTSQAWDEFKEVLISHTLSKHDKFIDLLDDNSIVFVKTLYFLISL